MLGVQGAWQDTLPQSAHSEVPYHWLSWQTAMMGMLLVGDDGRSQGLGKSLAPPWVVCCSALCPRCTVLVLCCVSGGP